MSPRIIDVGAVIDGEPIGGFQKLVVATCFLLMTLDTLNLALIAFAAPAIAAAWHVPIAQFGPVFALGLAGNLAGSILFGSAGDLWGRRYPVIVGVAIFGAFTLLIPFASSMGGLMVLRFASGIGLGGVLPTCVATSAEIVPARLRTVVVTAASCGLPLGSMSAGWMAFVMLPQLGWKSIFYAGGIVPLALLPLLIFWLPESIRFLTLKKSSGPSLIRMLRRIAPSRTFSQADTFVGAECQISGSGARGLFTAGRLPVTLLLWVMFVMVYLVTFLLLNWLPALLQQSGIPLQDAIFYSSIFSAGGLIGGVVLGVFSRRAKPRVLIAYMFSGGAASIAALGYSTGHVLAIVVSIFLAGFLVTGAQMTVYAVTSEAYPTAIRSTGVGWASGVGRIGSILGPLVGGILWGTGATLSGLMYATAIPVVVAAAASFLLARQPQEETEEENLGGNSYGRSRT
jgi:AAHS family 4-hydroxybenzoate transporter-like MFS transporter